MSEEIKGEVLERPEATPEDRERWAYDDHIETLKVELSHSKQREANTREELKLQRRVYEQLVERLASKRRWW